MINNLKNAIMFMILTTLFLVCNISSMPPIWPNWNCLTLEVKQYSILFKMQQGSNRINEFNHFKIVLDTAATYGYSKDDIIKILGSPSKASPTQLQYWLQDAQEKSTVIINFNQTTKQITGYGISNNDP